jgi:hypothetical protein
MISKTICNFRMIYKICNSIVSNRDAFKCTYHLFFIHHLLLLPFRTLSDFIECVCFLDKINIYPPKETFMKVQAYMYIVLEKETFIHRFHCCIMYGQHYSLFIN